MASYMFPVLKHSEIFACSRGIYLFNGPEGNISLLFEISIPQKNTFVLDPKTELRTMYSEKKKNLYPSY